LANGEQLEATSGHPFYVPGKGWNVAANLKAGDVLRLHNGITLVIKTVSTSTYVGRVYNFAVAQNANYFVGEDGVLVHNCIKATSLPVTRPGTPAWEKAVDTLKQGGRADIRVPSASDAKTLLTEGRGNMNRYKKYTDKPYQKGYEMHPNESHTDNAPHNDLPHVKWKDWHSNNTGKGHIFFDIPN